MLLAYEEVVDFIATGPTAASVASFQASEGVKARVLELIDRQKIAALTDDEQSELEHFLQLEHIMRLAKVRARNHMTGE